MKLQKEPIISKDDFIIVVDDIKKMLKAESDFNDALDAYTEERNVFLPMHKLFDKCCYNLLAYALGLNPKDDNDDNLLGWYIYESEFGTDPRTSEVIEKKADGTETTYNMSTPDKFYDYVVIYLKDKYKAYAHLYDNGKNNNDGN